MGAKKGQPWTMGALLVRSYVRVQFLKAAAITYYTHILQQLPIYNPRHV